jgi:hypothetical protein
MTIRPLPALALLAEMAACESSRVPPVDAAADTSRGDIADAATDGSADEARSDGGHCGRTHLGATITVHAPDGDTLSCSTASADGGFLIRPPRTWVGRVTGSDAHSISVSVCAPGAGNDDAGAADADGSDAGAVDAACAPGVLRIDAVAPGLDLTRFPLGWVRVKATASFFWTCQQALEITTADPIDGSTPSNPAGQLLLAVVDGNGIAFDDSPYEVVHVQLGCAPGRTCNAGLTADDYAFEFSRPGDTAAPARVYMGETVTWKTSAADFTVQNLRSFETGNCDDYWNWAYTIYADPK